MPPTTASLPRHGRVSRSGCSRQRCPTPARHPPLCRSIWAPFLRRPHRPAVRTFPLQPGSEATCPSSRSSGSGPDPACSPRSGTSPPSTRPRAPYPSVDPGVRASAVRRRDPGCARGPDLSHQALLRGGPCRLRVRPARTDPQLRRIRQPAAGHPGQLLLRGRRPLPPRPRGGLLCAAGHRRAHRLRPRDDLDTPPARTSLAPCHLHRRPVLGTAQDAQPDRRHR
jgi:hypothetical protein